MADLSVPDLDEDVNRMKYRPDDYVAVHGEPIWRDRSNFVFHMPIGQKDGSGEWEQLWWERVGELRFVLCCIPFFVYDLSLGDEVETNEEHVVLSIIKRSGQATFRVWLGDQDEDTKAKAMDDIQLLNPLVEWLSPNLVALSIGEASALDLASVLRSLEDRGYLHYETGAQRLFRRNDSSL